MGIGSEGSVNFWASDIIWYVSNMCCASCVTMNVLVWRYHGHVCIPALFKSQTVLPNFSRGSMQSAFRHNASSKTQSGDLPVKECWCVDSCRFGWRALCTACLVPTVFWGPKYNEDMKEQSYDLRCAPHTLCRTYSHRKHSTHGFIVQNTQSLYKRVTPASLIHQNFRERRNWMSGNCVSSYIRLYIYKYIYLLNMSLVIGVYAMFQLTCLCMFSSPRRKLFRTILECGLWHLHEPNRWALVFVVERNKTKQRKFVEPRGTRILKNLKACMLHDYDCCALGFCGVIFTFHRFISYCINSTWAQGCSESRHLRLW